MTHQHDHAHDPATATPAVATDSEIAPGRGSRTAGLLGPTGPRPSGLLMRKRDGNQVADTAEAAVGAASTSPGSALPDDLRSRFEGSLGTDLSAVRVHTGPASASAASAVGAKAYTLGNDIHFGAGHFDTSSLQGQQLIAHEVAHTVQQRGGTPTRQNKLEVSASSDAFEHEADRAASAMVGGHTFSLGGGTPGALARKEEGGPVSGGVALTKHSVKVTAKATLDKEFDLGYVKVTPGGEFSVDGTLQDKEAKEPGKKDADGTANLEAHRAEAESGAGTALKAQAEAGIEEQKGDFEADWESPEVERSTEGGGVTVTVNLKIHGKVYPVKLTLGELSKGEVNFLAVEVDVPIKLKEMTLWQNDAMKFVAAATVTTKLKIQPVWKKILPKITQQAATKLRPFMTEILAGITGDAIIAGGFVAIGASVLAALVIGAEELAEIDGAVARAHSALRRYGDGFSTGLGVQRNTSSSKLCFAEGQADAQKALATQVAAIQNHPVFQVFGFSADEITDALRAAAAPHVPEMATHAMTLAQPHVFARFAKEFYDHEMDSFFGTYSNAAAVAARLGVPDAIPPRKE